MKRLISSLLLVCASLGTAFAQAGGQPLDDRQVQAAKSAAESIAGIGRSRGAQFDAQGKLLAEPGPAGTNAIENQLQYVGGLTGVQGVEQYGRPGSGGAGAAAASVRGALDFSCARDQGKRKTLHGLSVWLTSCEVAQNQTRALTVRLCDATMKGGVCDTAAFGPARSLQVGQYGQIDAYTVGVGCNDGPTRDCRLTIDAKFSASGQAQELPAQAQAATGANTAHAALSATASDPAYTARMQSLGAEYNECVQRNLETLGRDGAVRSCDQQRAVQFAGAATAPGAQCDTTRQCIKEASRQLTYTRTCQRTIELTMHACDYQTPTATCDVTEVAATVLEPAVRTSTCTDESLKDAVFARNSDPVCTLYSDADGSCLQSTWQEYYTFPSKATKTGCVTGPYPLAGPFGPAVCDLSTEGREEECHPDGMWQGVCVKARVGYTCYARNDVNNPADSCKHVDLAGCQLTDSRVLGTTEGGLVTSQRETYSCTKEQRYCTQFAQPPAGSGCANLDMTYGLDRAGFRAPGSDGSLNQALATAGVLNAIEQNTSENLVIPLIFNGEDRRCKKPTGGLFGLFYLDCCRIDLERPKAQVGKANECTMEDVKLAAARRAEYDVYIGEYCSKRLRFPRKCIQRTQTYCVFQGVLPRIIHEQGRAQLAELVASGARSEVERRSMSFDYYKGEGAWTPPVRVNGSSVAAFQYPAYCADPATAEQRLQSDPFAVECPSRLVQWFAICDNPNGCGALPEAPEYGSATWTIQDADPLRNVSTTLSRYAVARGACDPAQARCQYEISAWPAGAGGRAMVSREVVFPLYSHAANDDVISGAIENDLQNIGDVVFRPFSHARAARPGVLPADVRLDYSTNGGQSWQSVQVPTSLAGEMLLPGSEIRLQGQCSATANMCEFVAVTPVTVQAKPWGSAQSPDCSGFTLGQLSVLDFSRMDLSEWLATVVDQVAGQTSEGLVGLAKSQFQAFNSVFQQTGQAASSSPQGMQIARVTPSEGFGPFEVHLRVVGAWPPFEGNPLDNPNRVTGVSVDWGDCSPVEALVPVTMVNGQRASGYEAYHTFEGPDKLRAPCGPLKENVTHKVVLTIHTLQSGTQTRVLEVVNAWSTMPGHASSGREQNAATQGDSLRGKAPGR